MDILSDALLVINPSPLVILEVIDFVPSSPIYSRSMEEFSVRVSLYYLFYPRFEFSKFIFPLENVFVILH